MGQPLIIIYGATGLTGGLVADALAARGIPFAIAGRDRGRLSVVAERFARVPPVHVANVYDEDGLAQAFAGRRVVFNCAGPFGTLGEPVVRAAIAAGAHYLDSSGEQAWMRDIYERCDSAARRAGVVVVNGCAFEIALGDWAAALAAREFQASTDPIDELVVGYALAGPSVSRGTQLSIIDSLSRLGNVWRIDRWEPIAPAAERRTIQFPDPFGERESLSFPSGEVITIPRHTSSRFVQTYGSIMGDSPTSRLLNLAANLLSPALPGLLASPLGAMAKAQVGATGRLSERARKASQFAIVAQATVGDRRSFVEVAGFDIYGLTAQIAANACIDLTDGSDPPSGVRAPTEVFDPQDHLERLDVTVTRGS